MTALDEIPTGWLDHRPRPHPADADEPECRECHPSPVIIDEGADRIADLYRRTGSHRDRPWVADR